MGLYGQSKPMSGSQSDRPSEWGPAGANIVAGESLSRYGLWGREFVYPERPGVLDCAYYIRTGSCGYGVNCRFNHPRDRSSIGGAVRYAGGEYPERPEEPSCQYYLRTGACKFGASCKFHHPRDVGGLMSYTQLNSYGYPLRLGEKECSYYLKTGQCKFGITCKFHHPQPNGMLVPESARPFYSTVQSASVPSSDQYGGTSNSYKTRPPLLAGSYMPGAYSSVLFPPGVVPVPGWSPYSGHVSPILSPNVQAPVGAGALYGFTHISSSAPSFVGSYAPLPSPSGPSSSSQKEKLFPQRPGQPDCQYYLKTGDCKFGSSCRYHHRPDWVVSKTSPALSPSDLPLRPGIQPCAFYLQNGHCKFGQTCRFDHPIRAVTYNASITSLTDMLVSPYMVGSSLAPSISYSELRPEFTSESKLDSRSSRNIPSSGNTSSSSAG